MKTTKITATFSNGEIHTRRTSNDKLKFAWRVEGQYESHISHKISKLETKVGFTSTRQLAEKAAHQYARWWKIGFKSEVVEVVRIETVEFKGAKSSKPYRVRCQAQAVSVSGRRKFIWVRGENNAIAEFPTLAEAQAVADEQTSGADKAWGNGIYVYEVVR
jgi:hypothetical protein